MIIINSVKIKVQIRNYPGPDKKVVEKLIPEVAKNCVGTGCPSTRPFMHKQNPEITSTITTMPTPKLLPKPVQNKIPEKSNVDYILEQKQNAIQQPVQSTADKVKPPIKSSTASSALEKLKAEDRARDVLESKNITKYANEPLVPYLPKSSTSASPVVYLPKTPSDITLVRLPLPEPSTILFLPLAEKVNIDSVSSSLPESSNTNSVTLPSQQTPSNSDTFQEEHKQKMSVVLEELKHKATAVQPEIYAETLQNGIVTESVCKPSTFTGKTFSNKSYTTSITPDTQVKDISDEQLIEELKKRELIKPDNGNTAVKIKLEDGTERLVGSSKNNIKLSSLGEAYYYQTKENQSNNNKIEKFEFDPKNVTYCIIAPPKISADCFVERGKQKHLIIVMDNFTGKCAEIGYLTSKTSAKLISNTQYKKYEQEQEQEQIEIVEKKEKQQFFVKFDTINQVKRENLEVVKYSEKYISTFSEDVKIYLDNILAEAKTINVSNDSSYVTEKDALEICKEFDKVAEVKNKNPKSKIQHPLSPEQKQLNKKNMEQQNLNKHDDS